MLNNVSFSYLVTNGTPAAVAVLRGNQRFAQTTGSVRFYPADKGCLVVAELFQLPYGTDEAGQSYGPFYGFHIHEGAGCGDRSGSEPFSESKGHFNPAGTPHPGHAGDLPPLLGNSGYAYLSCYTGLFTPQEIVGRTVVVHQHTDDFHTQPSGNSGNKLACGEIRQI